MFLMQLSEERQVSRDQNLNLLLKFPHALVWNVEGSLQV